MLKRIQKIKKIGKFKDCCVPGCSFSKETVVFGFNTQGKSTLTAILRSLQTGNNNILIGRKTFGEGGDQEIEIDFEYNSSKDKYVFKQQKWNKSNPNILIFDSKFISENIFEGENINFGQQKNLNTIIIDAKGQKLNRQIIELQKQSDELSAKKTEKTKEFFHHFPGYNLNQFKALPENRGINEEISKVEKEIKFEQEKSSIKRIVQYHISSIVGIDFSIKNVLSKTLDSKQEEIEKHINVHFSKKENAQNFLNEGLSFLKEKPSNDAGRSCVFCGQKLGESAENLVSIYASFFRGGYADLQKEIANAIKYFKSINLETILTKISTDLKLKELDIGLIDFQIKELLEYKKNFEKELEKKRDLNYDVNFTSFDNLKIGIDTIKNNIENLQKTKINTVAEKSVPELEVEKKKLEVIRKRFEPIWVKFCVDADTIDKQADIIRKKRDSNRDALEHYSISIFNVHKESINYFCKKMGADFMIGDFKPLRKIIGKNERIFTIKFFNAHEINIDGDETAPNFKNTLSESDKRLLAFAFFLSLLTHDQNLDKKIILLDDPMSSFDRERRRKTIHLITDIVCKYEDGGEEKILKPEQKIILTHEENFAKELKRLIPNACSIKITECRDGINKRSKISHTDFSSDFPDDDISNRIDKIKNILDSGSFSEAFEEDCRKVLEHIFKRKYHLDLKEVPKNKSVRTFTVELAKNKVNNFDNEEKSKKFLRLCDDLNIELHDGQSCNSFGDKESILKDFFESLKIM